MAKGTKLRSVGAVFLGFLTVVVPSVLTDVVLHLTHVYPPPDQPMVDTPRLLLALAYRCAYTIAGGWVTARTAPSSPMRHVTALVVIGFVAGAIGVISSLPGTLGPLWYPIALALLSPPLAWVGGRLAGAAGGAGRDPRLSAPFRRRAFRTGGGRGAREARAREGKRATRGDPRPRVGNEPGSARISHGGEDRHRPHRAAARRALR